MAGYIALSYLVLAMTAWADSFLPAAISKGTGVLGLRF